MTGRHARHAGLRRARGARSATVGVWVASIVMLTTGCATTTAMRTELDADSRASAIAECMDELGHDSTVATDGTITFTEPSSGELEDAIEQCTAEIPYAPSEDELLEIYALELQNAACLEALGYSIAPVPDEATYLATYNTADWWMPILSVTEAERPRAAAQCPPPTGNN